MSDPNLTRRDEAVSPCPGCGAAESRLLWTLGDRLFRTTTRRFDLHRCPSCSLEFLNPAPRPEELPAFYPEGYWVGPSDRQGDRGLRGRLTEAYRRVVLFDHVRFVRAVVERQRREGRFVGLLDVGCGDGSFLEGLGARPGAGMDWSQNAARAVLARNFPALRGHVEALPVRDGAFSVITMFHVLEHLARAEPCLEAVRRALAPGGSLVIQVPNSACWQRRLLGGRWAGYDPPRHLVNYSTKTLAETLERSGFEVLRRTQFSLRDNPTTLANSLAPGLYPPARATAVGGGLSEWGANLAYLGLVLAGLPFTWLESALGRGAAVMMEARPVTNGTSR